MEIWEAHEDGSIRSSNFIIWPAELLDDDMWPAGEWSPREDGGYFLLDSWGLPVDRTDSLGSAKERAEEIQEDWLLGQQEMDEIADDVEDEHGA